MSELGAVVTKLKKEFGDGIGGAGMTAANAGRIPTGIFPFDLATGGGFPMGRLAILYGLESSGKTSVMYMLMAYVQHVLKKKAVLVDVENTHDPVWAKNFGVDVDALVVLRPDTAEQAVDVIEAVLYADDVGIVGVDSIAALTTENEINSGAEKMIVGGGSYIVGKMVRKAVRALSTERQRGHHPLLLCINQIRIKIGVMFQDPETTPGGNSLKFASSLSVRLYGKDVFVKGGHPTLPMHKEVSGIIKKWKVPIVARNFTYDLTLVPHGVFGIGQSPSWKTVATHLQEYGLLSKVSGGWQCMGIQFKTLVEIQTKYDTDPQLRLALQQEVVQRALTVVIPPQGANGEVLDKVSVDTATGEVTIE